MANNVFQDWRRECEAVQREMDRLITAGRPQSPEERQVRQLQFTALIERRDAAARSLLQSSRRASDQQGTAASARDRAI
jgi:proline racemase